MSRYFAIKPGRRARAPVPPVKTKLNRPNARVAPQVSPGAPLPLHGQAPLVPVDTCFLAASQALV